MRIARICALAVVLGALFVVAPARAQDIAGTIGGPIVQVYNRQVVPVANVSGVYTSGPDGARPIHPWRPGTPLVLAPPEYVPELSELHVMMTFTGFSSKIRDRARREKRQLGRVAAYIGTCDRQAGIFDWDTGELTLRMASFDSGRMYALRMTIDQEWSASGFKIPLVTVITDRPTVTSEAVLTFELLDCSELDTQAVAYSRDAQYKGVLCEPVECFAELPDRVKARLRQELIRRFTSLRENKVRLSPMFKDVLADCQSTTGLAPATQAANQALEAYAKATEARMGNLEARTTAGEAWQQQASKSMVESNQILAAILKRLESGTVTASTGTVAQNKCTVTIHGWSSEVLVRLVHKGSGKTIDLSREINTELDLVPGSWAMEFWVAGVNVTGQGGDCLEVVAGKTSYEFWLNRKRGGAQ